MKSAPMKRFQVCAIARTGVRCIVMAENAADAEDRALDFRSWTMDPSGVVRDVDVVDVEEIKDEDGTTFEYEFTAMDESAPPPTMSLSERDLADLRLSIEDAKHYPGIGELIEQAAIERFAYSGTVWNTGEIARLRTAVMIDILNALAPMIYRLVGDGHASLGFRMLREATLRKTDSKEDPTDD